MKHNNLISINDLSKDEILDIFHMADYSDKIFTKHQQPLSGRILGSIFLQPSTRTQFSFQSAFIRLGGNYIGCSDASQIRCSYPYYESMGDLAKIVSNYCDIIVLRSNNEYDVRSFVNNSSIPVISAGSGMYEHPTQALVDLYTIIKLLGRIDNQKILIIGTPNQRTVNSLLLGLNLLSNIEVNILCQKNVFINCDIKKKLLNVKTYLYHSWDDLIASNKLPNISIVYVGEIFYDTIATNEYIITSDILKKYFSKEVIILSPLPRTNELSRDVDIHKGAKYFLQARLGLYIRAGLYLKYFI